MHHRPFDARRFVAIDCETTGLSPQDHQMVEIAWAVYEGGALVEQHTHLIALEAPLPSFIRTLTGLTPEAFVDAKPFSHLCGALCQAIETADFVVAYNAPFDRAFLSRALSHENHSLPNTPWLDPMVLARLLNRIPNARMNLRATCARYGVDTRTVHRALADAKACAALLRALAKKLSVTCGAAPPLESLLALQATFRIRQDAERQQRRRHLEKGA